VDGDRYPVLIHSLSGGLLSLIVVSVLHPSPFKKEFTNSQISIEASAVENDSHSMTV
jgi:hypothetical protein